MISIDGTLGEGGGQVLRTALSLSAITGQPFTIEHIRGKRKRPGLKLQHLTCVRAAAEVCNAAVQGAELHSGRLVFNPGPFIKPGPYQWDIGSAGSTTLVLQTVLPILAMAGEDSEVEIRGGTHNPMAPPLDFIVESFLPLLADMWYYATVNIEQYGFYPQGGGCIRARIRKREEHMQPDVKTRPPLSRLRARIIGCGLPEHVMVREREQLLATGDFLANDIEIVRPNIRQTANVVSIAAHYGRLTSVFTGFGERGKRAEIVAQEVYEQAMFHHRTGLPLEGHLADQILLYLGLAGCGRFVTSALGLHAFTNMEIISTFLPVIFQKKELTNGWEVESLKKIPL